MAEDKIRLDSDDYMDTKIAARESRSKWRKEQEPSVDASDERPRRKKRPVISEFYITDKYGNDIAMKLLGYAEENDKVYAIARPGAADPDKVAVFELFYAGDDLCFGLVKDRSICERIMDSYMEKLLK